MRRQTERRREGQDLDSAVSGARGRAPGQGTAGVEPGGMRGCPPVGRPQEGPGPRNPPARCRCVCVCVPRRGGPLRGPGQKTRRRCAGSGLGQEKERVRGSVGPPAAAYGARRRTSVRQGDEEEEGGPPRPRGWGEGGNKRGSRKERDKKQSGREGGRKGSKYRDVIRVGKRRGGAEGDQMDVEPGPRDGRGQRGVEIDEEQDGPGRWSGARVIAAAGGRHAVAGISATEKTSHSQGRQRATAAAEDKRAGQPRGGAAGSRVAGEQRGGGAARQGSRPRRGGPGRSRGGRCGISS